ncbi:MAG TPA: type II toxin-antitoxin system death-on-curing family toxin [Methylomirabilota bacterium]|nr:type II toxin-antitoxin system death-on-curing family toxin [Methylomirabilota bacterium]
MNTSYLTLEQILVIHEDQIERYEGISGLRNLELLESALFRPQLTFDGKDLYENVFEKAAALIHSLILNHPFVDGNKRTGMVAGLVFLEINEFSLKVDQGELVQAALAIASKKWDIEKITVWLKDNA